MSNIECTKSGIRINTDILLCDILPLINILIGGKNIDI